jgi:hypothetical protein
VKNIVYARREFSSFFFKKKKNFHISTVTCHFYISEGRHFLVLDFIKINKLVHKLSFFCIKLDIQHFKTHQIGPEIFLEKG